jgi:outer membrane protein assembly factor BamA
MPNPWDPFLQGPVLTLEPKFTRKGLLEKHLVWSLVPGFDVNLQEGYQYYSPRNRFGVDRWFLGWLHLALSHNLQAVDFFNTNAKLDANASLLGRDFRDPFVLSFLEFGASAFFADSIQSPRNGLILETTSALAGGPFGGHFDYQRLDAGLRAYWRPASRLQFASQLKTGLILPYGDSPGAPINLKYYLGGPSTLRGWASRRLSPRIQECDANGGNCTVIPIGGYTLVQGNLELRFRAVGQLYLVGFFDLGDVQAAEATYKVSEWNYAAGPGLRYLSPLGLVRLDAGFRLNDPGVYTGEPGWGLYFGLGEAF